MDIINNANKSIVWIAMDAIIICARTSGRTDDQKKVEIIAQYVPPWDRFAPKANHGRQRDRGFGDGRGMLHGHTAY